MEAMKSVALPTGAAGKPEGDETTLDSMVRELVRRKPQLRDEKKLPEEALPIPLALSIRHTPIATKLQLAQQGNSQAAGKVAKGLASQGLASQGLASQAHAGAVLPKVTTGKGEEGEGLASAVTKKAHEQTVMREGKGELVLAPSEKSALAADGAAPVADGVAAVKQEALVREHKTGRDKLTEQAAASLQMLSQQTQQAAQQQLPQQTLAQQMSQASAARMASLRASSEASTAREAVDGTQSGLTYRFQRWGTEHSVTVQGQVDGSMLLKPSDSLVAQRLGDQWQSGNPQQWNLARDDSQQQRGQQQQQQDAEDDA